MALAIEKGATQLGDPVRLIAQRWPDPTLVRTVRRQLPRSRPVPQRRTRRSSKRLPENPFRR